MGIRTIGLLSIHTRDGLMNEPILHHLDWIDDFTLTDSEVGAIADPEWIIPDLVISGHLILIPAEPNGGKTTIMMYLSGLMAAKGYQVLFVNADISGSDAKYAYAYAKDYGFNLLLPDFKLGKSIKDIGAKLEKMAAQENDLSGIVLIIDTIKKLIDILDKRFAKEFFALMRKLTAKGMTIILLAHTNKHKDDRGLPIYEGTADMRSDVDELIYLLPHKHDDGTMTVTTKPDKIRGAFKPITFTIDKNRKVTQEKAAVDVESMKAQQKQQSADQVIINGILDSLKNQSLNQKDIITHCLNIGLPERSVKSVLSTYSDQQTDFPVFWSTKRGKGKEIIYQLVN